MLADINGIKMYYEEKGTGTPLVFVHGLGDSGDCWRFQREIFATGFRTITMDQRGHRRNEDGEELITLDHLREDIIALLDYLKIDKAHFVGHSMGSKVLQDVIAHYPERFLSLTLCSSCADFGNAAEFLKPRLERIASLTMEELGTAVANAACLPDFPERNPEVFAEMKKVFQSNRREPYSQCTAVIGDPRCDHRASLPNIKVPTLIMVGIEDQTTPVRDSQNLNLLIPGSFLVIIPQAAHMIPVENPQAVNRALAHFLAALEPEALRPILSSLTN
ncbi:MAG: alpha/beta fold hydrolase [Peptococcia bacterium]